MKAFRFAIVSLTAVVAAFVFTGIGVTHAAENKQNFVSFSQSKANLSSAQAKQIKVIVNRFPNATKLTCVAFVKPGVKASTLKLAKSKAAVVCEFGNILSSVGSTAVKVQITQVASLISKVQLIVTYEAQPPKAQPTLAPSSTPTPTPSMTATPSPTPSPTLTPSPTPAPTATPSAAPSPLPSPVPTPTPSLSNPAQYDTVLPTYGVSSWKVTGSVAGGRWLNGCSMVLADVRTGQLAGRGTINSAGGFSFYALPGTWTLQVSSQKFWAPDMNIWPCGNFRLVGEVVITNDIDLQISVPELVAANVLVLDASGNPLEGASVSLSVSLAHSDIRSGVIDGSCVSVVTNSNGVASCFVPAGANLTIYARKLVGGFELVNSGTSTVGNLNRFSLRLG